MKAPDARLNVRTEQKVMKIYRVLVKHSFFAYTLCTYTRRIRYGNNSRRLSTPPPHRTAVVKCFVVVIKLNHLGEKISRCAVRMACRFSQIRSISFEGVSSVKWTVGPNGPTLALQIIFTKKKKVEFQSNLLNLSTFSAGRYPVNQ